MTAVGKGKDTQPDIIVIGAGASGIPCAVRLAEEGLDVLLVEAGQGKPGMRSRLSAIWQGSASADDWKFTTERDASLDDRSVSIPAARRMGGSVADDTVLPPTEESALADLDGWRAQDLAPIIRRIAARLRPKPADGTPASRWIDAAREAGLDAASASSLHGKPSPLEAAWIYEQLKRFSFVAGARAIGITMENGRATGVTLREGTSTRHVPARRGVVLAAGALGTPRLLLLSGIGPAAHLRELGLDIAIDLPGVGGNLQDFPGAYLARTFAGSAKAVTPSAAVASAPGLQFQYHASRTQARTRVAVLQPQSRGRMSLRSADPVMAPRIELQLFANESEVAALEAGVAAAARLMEIDPPAGPVRRIARPLGHACGTARMGDVCDHACLVTGARNLWVADASLLPALPPQVSPLTGMVIGERAAELVVDRVREDIVALA